MMADQSGLTLETTALYEIRVQGTLDKRWCDRLGDAEIQVQKSQGDAPVTVLTGQFVDQAALAGALNLLYDLGFPLLSVQCLETIR
jgi:hypothetical protein